MKSGYSKTKLNHTIDDAITRENEAVIEEGHTGTFVETADRQWFRELVNSPDED